jgi:murein DD-endopeptidase MepM/ murein hydrolase activator NlpD
MKKIIMVIGVMAGVLLTSQGWAHQIYIKKDPTNEAGIEFGVNNASEFVRWRAYVRGLSDNSQGLNSGWTSSGNGWWYYDLASLDQRVMWRVSDLANQQFIITYWVFKNDSTWEYGPQVTVVSDQIAPDAWFNNLANGQVINQRQFNLQVGSSDNLSRVAALRLYVIVPNDQVLTGWIPSGINNQYYKEFPADSINYTFTAPADGFYTFTLWVKDQAGNIAYEPGGPVQIQVKTTTEPTPPLAPSNLQLFDQQNNVQLTWQDNASDEEGFLLYRNWQYLAKLPANTTSYTDTELGYGDNYCYRVVAFKGNLNSQSIEACIYLEEPVSDPDYQYADGFVYPMACDYIYRLEPDSQIPSGACYDYQPFGSLFAYSNEIHVGSDLNRKAINDLGEPLFAIANALVWELGWTPGWGNYLILQIKARPGQSFWLSNGEKVTQVYVLYAHLDEIFIETNTGQVIERQSIVAQQTYVRQNWQIGTIGDGNGNFSPHLHFEIRVNGYDQLGQGYWPVNDNSYLDYFVDPLEFIDNNRAADDNPQLTVYIHGYDQDDSKPVYLDLQADDWQRQGRNYDGLPLASVGWANHIWLIPSNHNQIARWDFQLPLTGAWSVYTVIPRYYAQAHNVRYQVWHSSQDISYPYETMIDQFNDDENQEVFLGTFDFYNTQRYGVNVFSQTEDYPAQNVAVDTLILVYQGEPGSGGGQLPSDDQVKTINSDGSLHFKYQGISTQPELHCTGGGLFWSDLILADKSLENSVQVSFSDTVYCNIEFENNTWLADWQGLLPGHQLLVNGQLITAIKPNNYGGYNLVFNLVVNEQDNNPIESDDNNDPGSSNKKDQPSSGSLGCHIGSGLPPFAGLANSLILLIPPFVIFAFRAIKYKLI